MINRYNRKQIILSAFAAIGGFVCCYLTYLFFRYVPAFVAAEFGYRMTSSMSVASGLLGLAAAFFSGYRVWQRGGGLYGYHESALYHDWGGTAGGSVVDFYAHRVTGPAYLLSQIFLAGPLLVFRTTTLLNSLIPANPELEERLRGTLGAIRTAKKWQSLNEYPDHKAEVLYLAQMGLIDFSAFKGTPRIKAC